MRFKSKDHLIIKAAQDLQLEVDYVFTSTKLRNLVEKRLNKGGYWYFTSNREVVKILLKRDIIEHVSYTSQQRRDGGVTVATYKFK